MFLRTYSKGLEGKFDIIVTSTNAAYTFNTGGASGVVWTANYPGGITTATGDNPIFDLSGNTGDCQITANVILNSISFSNAYKNDLKIVNTIDASNATSLSFSFRNCANLVEINSLFCSNTTDFTRFCNNSNIGFITNSDYSNGLNFSFGWTNASVSELINHDFSSGVNFNSTWQNNKITEVDNIDVSNGENFSYTWAYNSITTFGLLDLSSGTNFSFALRNNNLNAQSVENFLQALVNNGRSNLDTMIGKDTDPLTATAQALYDTLTITRGWTINFN